MQLNFRDLKQQNFSIDAEPSETIADVKSKIASEKGFDAAQLKLIYSGKILKDTDTVESYNFEAKSYIVCMQQKPKPAPAAAASSSKAPSTPAPVPAQTPSAPAPAPAAPNTTAPATPSPAPAQPTSPREFNDPSSMTLGNEREAAISNLEGMGLGSRADVEAAMRAAFYNPDRAVEYLLNGIPENLRQQAPAQRPASSQQPASTTQGTTGATETATTTQTGGGGGGGEDEPVNLFEAAARASQGGNRGGAAATGARSGGATAAQTGSGEANPLAGAGGNLDFLRDNQTFQHLRQLVQQQPQMLEQVLQQVGASNPQLAGLIASNPEQFLQLLAEGDGGEEGGTPLPPGAQPISVTEEERDAIERLCRLGFERDLVIQAYFACDKNEELAANFLFDQPDEGDDGGAPPAS